MKLIIAGSRTINLGPSSISDFVDNFNLRPQEVVSGTANGVDKAGEFFADTANFFREKNPIKISRFPADWDKYGKGAGHIRNRIMAQYADALLLIWDGESRGSKNMREEMKALGKPIYEVIIKKPSV